MYAPQHYAAVRSHGANVGVLVEGKVLARSTDASEHVPDAREPSERGQTSGPAHQAPCKRHHTEQLHVHVSIATEFVY